ncbi:MAG TPA: NAD(P)H-quinone oxidoreductase [Gammaproteobacteria bacterium]|jgi:NAD(P)H dehydrogenase (quinone)|nr:NAD(P)H-quinone oxidoreductase [Gammaproteobacteria bacterium]
MTTRILILYHSVSGNTRAMAQHVARGVESVTQAEAILRTVPEVSAETETVAPPVPSDGAPYGTTADLSACDGLILGSPTCFGNMSASLKYFMDQTSAQWFSGDLSGKPAGVFTSTSSLHGGQEAVLLSMMIPLMHHGMLMTSIPYSVPELANTTSGGTPYGASHTSGPNGNNPLTDDEKAICKALGQRVADIAARLKAGAGTAS